MGKASFIDIQDKQGRIQCHIKRDLLEQEEYLWFKKSDIGDIYGIVGKVFMTQRGEITIEVQEMTLLSKSLQVLPDKWSGLKDTDLRYRQRYVDLIMNTDVSNMFRKRALIVKEIKRVLEEDFGYLEVDTPILTTIAGGANARPFDRRGSDGVYAEGVVPVANVFQSCSRRVLVWPGRIGVCGGLAVARRDRASDRVAVGGCCHDWCGIGTNCSSHECTAAGEDIDKSD